MVDTIVYSKRDIEKINLELFMQLGFRLEDYKDFKPYFLQMMKSLEKKKKIKLSDDYLKDSWNNVALFMFMEQMQNKDEFQKLSLQDKQKFNLVCLGKGMMEVLT